MTMPPLVTPGPTPSSDLMPITRVLRGLGLMRLEDHPAVGLTNFKTKMTQTPQDILTKLQKYGRNPDSVTFLKSLKPDINEEGLTHIFGQPKAAPSAVSDIRTAPLELPKPMSIANVGLQETPFRPEAERQIRQTLGIPEDVPLVNERQKAIESIVKNPIALKPGTLALLAGASPEAIATQPEWKSTLSDIGALGSGVFLGFQALNEGYTVLNNMVTRLAAQKYAQSLGQAVSSEDLSAFTKWAEQNVPRNFAMRASLNQLFKRSPNGGFEMTPEAAAAAEEEATKAIVQWNPKLAPSFTPGGSAVLGQTIPLAQVMAGARAELTPQPTRAELIAKRDTLINSIPKSQEQQIMNPAIKRARDEIARLDQQIRAMPGVTPVPEITKGVAEAIPEVGKTMPETQVSANIGRLPATEPGQPEAGLQQAEKPITAQSVSPLSDYYQEQRKRFGEAIAQELGIKFDGVQEGLGMQFTDPQTGSTTYGNTLEQVKSKLDALRQKFNQTEIGGMVTPTQPLIAIAGGEGGVLGSTPPPEQTTAGGAPPREQPPVTSSGNGAPPNSPLSKIQGMWDRGKLPRKTPVNPNKPTLMENFNDAYYELRKMQTRVIKGESIEAGGKDDVITFLVRAPGAVNAGVTRAKLILGAIKKVAPDVNPDDINSIIYINHAQEVLRQKGAKRVMAGGFTTEAELNDAMDEIINRLGDNFESAHNAADILTQAYDSELSRLVDSGLVSQDLATELRQKYPWYNPLDYFSDLEELEMQGKAIKPFNVVSSGLKRLTEQGTSKDAIAPLNILGEQLIKNEVRIVKNDTAKAIIDLAKKDNTIEVKKISGVKPVAQVNGETVFRRTWEDLPGTLSFFEGGKRQIYQVPDFIYREANVLSKMTANPVTSIVGAVNGVTRAAFTSASLPFVTTNVMNDSLTAFLNRGITIPETVARLIQSIRGLENDSVMQSFRLSGGLQARFYGESGEQLAKDAELASKVTKGGKSFVNSALKSVMRPIEAMGELGEQSPRMALFSRQLDKTLPGWRQMTPEQVAATPEGRKAAADSVELTINFARGGYLIKSANPFVIFLNASMEGTKLPYRALRDNPAARWRLALVLGGMIGLVAYNLTHKEYMDVPNYQRWGSVIVMLPPTEKNPDGSDKPNYLVVIPRTREWSMFTGSATYAMEKLYTENPESLGQFAAELFPNVSPINDIPIMPILQEPVEQMANYDFFTGNKVVSQSLENLPATEQTTPSVSRTIEGLSQRAGLSPVRVQHAFNGLLGGAFKTTASVADYIAELISPREVKPEIIKLAEQYQSLPVVTKTKGDVTQKDFLDRINASDKRAMLNFINRRPPGLPIISSITSRFFPQRGGQLESNQYELEQTVKDMPFYQTKDMTPEQMKSANTKLWTEKKAADAKIIDRYDLAMIKKTQAQREKYLAENPDVDATLLLWGGITIHSLEAAKLLESEAKKYGIPIDKVPAFALNDKGKERIPSDRNLWKPYFDYYALPGSSYLAMSKEQVDAGELPAKYLAEWQAYQKLKTDVAKTLFKNNRKEVSKGDWRDDFRRANPAFDKWLIDQEYNQPLKPKTTKWVSGGSQPRIALATGTGGGFSGGSVSPRRTKAKYPKFRRLAVSRGLSISAPDAPRI